MRLELDAALVRDFPRLYRDRHGSTYETRMCDGFAVGDGWEPLIRRLSEKLEPIARETGLHALQVKEKFGGLRFYVSTGGGMRSVIEAAEEESYRTCEHCGAVGSTREYGRSWLITLCNICHEREVARRVASV
jgi:hypothetical protein